MQTKDDTNFLRRALELAERGMGHTRPNPPVGAVIVKNGKIIGEGWHKKAGGDHAEVAAIKNALRHLNRSTAQPLNLLTATLPAVPRYRATRTTA